jgi:hypothetical protein
MSHVATVQLEVKDLDALAKACQRLGLELRRGQKTYKWFGKHVGDYPLPAGFAIEDLGQCEHAIAIAGDPADSEAYEVGVVKRRDGKGGYSLLWDFFGGGFGLQEKVGENCNALRQAYSIEIARKHAQAKGYQVQERVHQGGAIKLLLSK